MAGNKSVTTAKKNKNDEFYTQLSDIEKELRYYKKHFEGKVVLCNCDDPYESNFFKYFALNFNRLKIKKLICTSYVSSPVRGTIFEYFEDTADEKKPYKAIITKVHDATGDGAVDMFDVAELFKIGENHIEELQGDGDFRSEECIELLKESDIVVTNPPFSLFREYVAQLMDYKKKFIVIGSLNAVTYKEIFPLLMDNKVWLGATRFNGGATHFIAPPDLYDEKKMSNPKNAFWKDGLFYWRVNGVRWFTNLDIRQRHDEIILVKKYNTESYCTYDNYDAINVDKVTDIPMDWEGLIGVPVSFMDKYCPEQFEILGCADANILPEDWRGASRQIVEDYYKQGNKGQISEGWRNPIYYDNQNKVIAPYKRILIRNKHPEGGCK